MPTATVPKTRKPAPVIAFEAGQNGTKYIASAPALKKLDAAIDVLLQMTQVPGPFGSVSTWMHGALIQFVESVKAGNVPDQPE